MTVWYWLFVLLFSVPVPSTPALLRQQLPVTDATRVVNEVSIFFQMLQDKVSLALTPLADQVTQTNRQLQQWQDESRVSVANLTKTAGTLTGAVVSLSDTTSVLTSAITNLTQVAGDLVGTVANLTSQLAAGRDRVGSDDQVKSPTTCPPGWARLLQRCFLIPPEKASWFRAAQRCPELHPAAQLASIHADTENKLIHRLIGERDAQLLMDDLNMSENYFQDGFHIVWIGLRLVGADAWQWSDGSPVDFIKWWSGVPNNYRGLENCADFSLPRGYTDTSDYGWNDLPCDEVVGFVCALELEE